MKRTICIALLLTFGVAQAAEWVSLGKTDDGKHETFVDVSDIKVAGNIRRVWLKAVNEPHTVKGAASDSRKWIAHSLSRMAFDCDDETWKPEALINYYDDDTSSSAPAALLASSSWEPVAPETALHAAMDFTCSWKPK